MNRLVMFISQSQSLVGAQRLKLSQIQLANLQLDTGSSTGTNANNGVAIGRQNKRLEARMPNPSVVVTVAHPWQIFDHTADSRLCFVGHRWKSSPKTLMSSTRVSAAVGEYARPRRAARTIAD